VLEEFATRKDEAIDASDRFNPVLAKLETDAGAFVRKRREQEAQERENQKRAWLNRLNILAGLVRPVTAGVRMDNLVYSQDEIERSNAALAETLRAALDKALVECEDRTQRVRAMLSYLQRFRNRPLPDEWQRLESIEPFHSELRRELANLPVLEPEPVRAYAERLRQLQQIIQELDEQVRDIRNQREALDSAETPVLEALALAWQPLELFAPASKGDAMTLPALFDVLEGLYRKGHIDIQVRPTAPEATSESEP
jgi:hypothetical protein